MAVSTVKGLGNLPTTIEAALQPSTEARIITEPDEPFRIVHVNEVWCRTCGYDAEEVLGQTCKFLHGPGTCGLTLSMLKQALQLKRGLAVQLLNYTKAGRPFTNTLQVAPLYNQSGAVTHYLGVVMARYLDAPPAGTAQQSSSMTTRGQGLPSGGLPSQGLGGFPQGMKTANAPGMSLPGINLGGGYGSYGSGGGMGLLGAVDGSSSGDFTQGGPLTDDFGEGAISPGCGRVPPFLTKLTEILTVEDSEVVTLNANTPSFTICDPQRFAKEVSEPPR